MDGAGHTSAQQFGGSGPRRGDVVLRAMVSGFAIGAAAGVVSGAASFGPLGAVFGLVFGLMATVVPTALGTAVLAAVTTEGDPERYLRRLDLVLGAFAVAAGLGAVGWASLGALSGPIAPISAFATVLVGLWLARRWLRELTAPQVISF